MMRQDRLKDRRPIRENAIIVEHVSKTLGNKEILKNINLSMQKSDIFNYLGPKGAGKTTTITIILGLLNPTVENVQIMGKPVDSEEVRKKSDLYWKQTDSTAT
ncbi:MAG TPA: ATP-binding cassette domain-containing protein [Coprothermobacter sp.]|nr:ATP-binding cassette domain-containing protein [Coprothermobacter sp.]